jgi:hypothetical protein
MRQLGWFTCSFLLFRDFFISPLFPVSFFSIPVPIFHFFFHLLVSSIANLFLSFAEPAVAMERYGRLDTRQKKSMAVNW